MLVGYPFHVAVELLFSLITALSSVAYVKSQVRWNPFLLIVAFVISQAPLAGLLFGTKGTLLFLFPPIVIMYIAAWRNKIATLGTRKTIFVFILAIAADMLWGQTLLLQLMLIVLIVFEFYSYFDWVNRMVTDLSFRGHWRNYIGKTSFPQVLRYKLMRYIEFVPQLFLMVFLLKQAFS